MLNYEMSQHEMQTPNITNSRMRIREQIEKSELFELKMKMNGKYSRNDSMKMQENCRHETATKMNENGKIEQKMELRIGRRKRLKNQADQSSLCTNIRFLEMS